MRVSGTEAMLSTDEAGVGVDMVVDADAAVGSAPSAAAEPLRRLSVVCESIARTIAGVALAGEFAVIFFNVLLRVSGGTGFVWVNDIAVLGLTTVAFLGGAIAYRRGQHVALQALQRLAGSARGALESFAELAVLGIAVGLCITSAQLVSELAPSTMTSLDISKDWFVFPLVGGSGLIALFSLERLSGHRRRDLLGGLAIAAGMAVVGVLCQKALYGDLTGTGPALAAVIPAVVLTVLGVPIAFSLASGSLAYLLISPTPSMTGVVATMQDSTGNFLLLAIPFFIAAGFLLTRLKLSTDLVTGVLYLLKRFRGGGLQAVIATMYLFSGVSGSKAADIAAVSAGITDPLVERGYKRAEVGAVLTASGAMGESIPPSIAMLVLGSITTIPVAGLFAAGLVPAALLAACIGIVVYLRARKMGSINERSMVTRAEVKSSAPGMVLGLVVPVILAGGIILGIATPTEVSSFAVVYSIIVGLALCRRRGLSWSKVVAGSIDEAATVAGFVLLLNAAGQAFASTLSLLNIPQAVGSALSPAGEYGFILASIAVLVVFGAALEGLPALFVMAPIMMPTAAKLGIDELQYGVVFILAMGIGFYAPYVGLGTYITAGLVSQKVEAVSRQLVRYSCVLLAGLLIVAFVPAVSQTLPSLLHLT